MLISIGGRYIDLGKWLVESMELSHFNQVHFFHLESPHSNAHLINDNVQFNCLNFSPMLFEPCRLLIDQKLEGSTIMPDVPFPLILRSKLETRSATQTGCLTYRTHGCLTPVMWPWLHNEDNS